MQAARGTSLNGDDTQSHLPRRHPSATRLRAVLGLVALAAYAVDLGTKVLAVEHLSGGPDRPLVGQLLVLHLTRNPGAAFSTGTEYTVLLSCVAILALGVVLHLGRRVGSPLWALALGLVLVLLVSGLVEGFVTPSPLPAWLRLGIGFLVFAAYWAYTLILGRRAVAAGHRGDLGVVDRGDAVITA